MTSPEDPEQRIAELEKQVADARRIADLERQLAEARSQQPPPPPQMPPPPPQMPQMPMNGAADVIAAIERFQPGWGRSFQAAGGYAPPPPPDTRLADAPRRVPLRFVLAELLPFRWWYLFALFMVAIPPIALWMMQTELIAPAAVVTIVVIYGFQFWTARKRLALLKWGRVAQVIGSEVVSRGNYYSGTTYSNVWLPQAHGWTVSRQLWSGGSTKTRVGYVLDGHRGEITLKGRAYVDGVVLADQRRPERALCVSSFAYDLDRDESGNWVGTLRTRLVIGMVIWPLIVIAWLVVAFGISTGVASSIVTEVSATKIDPGGTATVSGSGNQTVYCNDGHLTVNGGSTVTVHGHCASLDVSGIDGVVTVDSVDTITLGGIDNRVTYHSGTPKVTNSGINNTAVRG